jgi:hypothetical protein
MTSRPTASIVALAVVFGTVTVPSALFAQSTDPRAPTILRVDDSGLPQDPQQRLSMAESAFNQGDFERIPTLLKPVLEPRPILESEEDRIRARELLGVGLYFEAQSATDSERRNRLMRQARNQFLQLLKERPDYQLDSLIFPASVVELFESVRNANAEQLAALQADEEDSEYNGNNAATSIYIERYVVQNPYAVNYLPFGAGQFQNDEPAAGALFAAGQGVGLAAHITGFIVIESLRQPDTGKFTTDGSPSDYDRARAWRGAQIAGLSLFGGLWLWSVIDALVKYEPRDVRIRTLDEPPPELRDSPEAERGQTRRSTSPKLGFGLGSLRIEW